MPINDEWMDRGEDPNVVAQQYEDQIERLEAELVALRVENQQLDKQAVTVIDGVMAGVSRMLILEGRVRERDAELAALREQIAAFRAADRQRTLLVDALQSELAALPTWTRIDPHDRTTWPPEHDAWVLNVVRYDDASYHLVATWGRVLNQADLIRFGQQWWLPIRLPWDEADNGH